MIIEGNHGVDEQHAIVWQWLRKLDDHIYYTIVSSALSSVQANYNTIGLRLIPWRMHHEHVVVEIRKQQNIVGQQCFAVCSRLYMFIVRQNKEKSIKTLHADTFINICGKMLRSAMFISCLGIFHMPCYYDNMCCFHLQNLTIKPMRTPVAVWRKYFGIIEYTSYFL